MIEPSEREKYIFERFENLYKLLFKFSAVSGLILFIIDRYFFLAGFGLTMSLVSVSALLLFSPYTINDIQSMDTKKSILSLVVCIVGIGIILFNHFSRDIPFLYGVGTALSMYAGIFYCLEMFRNFKSQIP